MLKTINNTVLLLTILLSAYACTATKNPVAEGKSVEIKHAGLLRITEGEGYILATITNPWDTAKVLHSYVLVPADKELPSNLPKGDVIRTPLKKAVVTSSVHCSLINELGAYSAIGAVCDKDYIYLAKLKEDIANGKVADVGSSMTPNIEKIIDLSPDAILVSPYENSGSYDKLGTLSIPLIECADYMEEGALARAEWIRFYGLLFGRETVADSIFADVEKSYNELKNKVKDCKEHAPKLLAEKRMGNTWYVPGGNSTMGLLYSDAGADYLFAQEKKTGSLEMSPEKVFDASGDAEIWLLKYNQPTDLTLQQLADEWDAYTRIPAYNNKKVYGCNLSNSLFYEETPFHPELLLKDLVSILHPAVLPGYQAKYYRKLE